MVYGYARVSTKTQAKDGNSLEVQENALKAAGAAEIYADAFTGTKSRRPEQYPYGEAGAEHHAGICGI